MTGKHSTKNPVPPPAAPSDMPDPDNLQIDVTKLPYTGPITLPRRD